MTPKETPAQGESQGLCDTTQTERFFAPDCLCKTYEGNLGPCRTFEKGGNGRCALCDHEPSCHPETPGQALASVRLREASTNVRDQLGHVLNWLADRDPRLLEILSKTPYMSERAGAIRELNAALALPPSKAEDQAKAYTEAKAKLLEDFDLLWKKHDRINGGWGIEEYCGGLEHIIMNFRARMKDDGL